MKNKLNFKKIILIADEFKHWLEEISKRYDMDKDDVQELIREFLL